MTAALGLGSAQFGTDYGISNPRGRVAEDEVRHILQYAADCKILPVDVAFYDGDVERILGRCWPFPSPFKPQIRTQSLDKGLDWIEARLKRCVDHMGLARAHAAFVDCPEDLMGADGANLWKRLETLKSNGLIAKIGISAHIDDEPLLLAKRFKPDIMQVPVSILDQRLVKDGTIEALAEMGVEVQVRSVFTQGLLFVPRETLPASLQPFGPHLSKLRRIMAEAGTDPLHAALSYVMNLKGVSTAIVGVTSAAELRAIVAASERPKPDLPWASFALTEDRILDPRLWFLPDEDLPQKPAAQVIKAA